MVCAHRSAVANFLNYKSGIKPTPVLEWKIGKSYGLRMLEGGLQPTGSQRVGHNWRTNTTPPTWSKIKPREFASISFFGFQSLQLVCLLLYTIYSLLIFVWIARRSNQSILKEVSPEYSLEGLMLKWKLQYFGHLMEELTHLKRPWCWERSKAGKGTTEDEVVRQHHQFNGHEYEQTPGDSESQESLACCSPYDHKGLWHELVTGQQKKITSTLNKGREPNKS